MHESTSPRYQEHLALQETLRRLPQLLSGFRGLETRIACYLLEATRSNAHEDWEISWWPAPDFEPHYLAMHLTQEAASFILAQEAPREFTWEQVQREPFFENLPHLERYRSFYWWPVRVGERILGALLFVHPSRRFFDEDRRMVLNMVGDIYALLRQNQLCRETLVHTRQRIYGVEEEVRRRLARDLHDGPAQTLSALVMEAQYLHRLAQHDPEALMEGLQELEEKARKAVNEIRQVLYILRPVALEEGSLKDALEQLLARLRQTFTGELQAELDPEVLERLSPEQQRHLFYLVAEALNNAVKHANAQQIVLRLYREDHWAVLEVQDDGLGFDPSALEQIRRAGHYGILNMEERAQLLGGELHLESQPGEGTRIRLRFPLPAPRPTLQAPTTEGD